MNRAARNSFRSLFRHRLDRVLLLEERAVPTVLTFQQGVEGTTDGGLNGFVYAGTQDVELQSANSTTNFGTNSSISVDRQDGAGARQGLLRFDDIFGPSLSQVPFGATINSAKLTVRISSASDVDAEMGFYRMKMPWSQSTATAKTFLPILGVQTDGVEAEAFRDYNVADTILTKNNIFTDTNVTASFQAWATGTSNFGWLIDQTGVNGWDFQTSEDANFANRPKLTIDFTAPTGGGTFKLAQSAYTLPEPDSGSKASVLLVTRNGGLTGTVTVDYTISPINATAGVDYDNTVTTGTLTFGPNVTNQPLQVKLLGDTTVEGPESFKITLSNPTNGSSIAVADITITIGDNDLLLNEIVANMTNLADDGYEYVEITGAPNATIPNGVSFAAFNSESGATNGIGNADVVVDLSGQKLGSNGLLIITPTNFKYTVPLTTTQVIATQLDKVGGGISDDVESFTLVYSPDLVPVMEGVDYDTSTGTYVDDATPFLNDGVLDVSPFVSTGGKAPAILLDSVGGCEGPNGQADRIVTLARPAVRVTIPDDRAIVGEVSRFLSDGFSRFVTDRVANNTGSWYNGELNGAVVLYDLGPVGNYSSASMPPGGQITPGEVNLPRGIAFELTSINVDETAGTVTLLVNRTGDNSVATSVNFATANGTALARLGKDFTAKSGTLNFPIGVDQQPIVIDINNDSTPEGFESFFVNLSNASAPFALVTPQAVVTINDNDALVATFQDGDLPGEYNGTRDVGLYAWLSGDKLGSDLTMSIDRSDDDPTLSTDLEKPDQGLIRFDDLFGSGPEQVPFGSTIYGGFITVNATDTSNQATRISFHRMLVNWTEFSATFANPAPGVTNGVTYDDVEARAVPDGILSDPNVIGPGIVQLSADTLQAWANGEPNYGWTMQSDSTNGWDFDTSDQIGPGNRPKLTLIYTPPAGEGTVRFSDPTFTVNEDAGTATVTVQRVGASTNTLTIDWSITGGTATSGDDFKGPLTGKLTFLPTDLTQTFTIPIENDLTLETNETILLSLSGAGVSFTRDTAKVMIRDNDFNLAAPSLLLNEFNINPSGNDFPFEFAEFVGTANTPMGNLYFVSMRGDTDVFSGCADSAIDLSNFSNGANGYTIIRSANGYSPPAGATQINLSQFDTGDIFQNGSNSFLLIYSPQATIAEGYDFDWANTGDLNLPTGAVVVDAVGFAVPASGGKVYGGAELVQSYTPQAMSRYLGNTNATSDTAWFRGRVSGSSDSLSYSSTDNTGLPVVGATLTPGGANTSDTAPLTIVASVTIDAGTAQRSMVRSLTVTFSNPVEYMGANTFRLTDQLDNPIAGVVLHVTGVGTNTLTITFSGSPIIGGSLADGKYRLEIDGDNLYAAGRMVDGKGDMTPGSNGTTDFHRIYGDGNGDGSVNSTDFAIFRSFFGVAGPAFDYDNNGVVNSDDFAEFRKRFGLTLP